MGELNTCPQSDLGLPTLFFKDVPVRRGRNSVPGSKHTSLNGSSSGLRSMCPNHLNWDFNTWLLKGNTLQRFRTLACEMRLIKGAGIFAILLNIRACAPSREALRCSIFLCSTPMRYDTRIYFSDLSVTPRPACTGPSDRTLFQYFLPPTISPNRNIYRTKC